MLDTLPFDVRAKIANSEAYKMSRSLCLHQKHNWELASDYEDRKLFIDFIDRTTWGKTILGQFKIRDPNKPWNDLGLALVEPAVRERSRHKLCKVMYPEDFNLDNLPKIGIIHETGQVGRDWAGDYNCFVCLNNTQTKIRFALAQPLKQWLCVALEDWKEKGQKIHEGNPFTSEKCQRLIQIRHHVDGYTGYPKLMAYVNPKLLVEGREIKEYDYDPPAEG